MQLSNDLWFPDKDKHMRDRYAKGESGLRILKEAFTYVKHFRRCVDGGAFIGLFSLEMSKHFDVVLSFEPGMATRECLKKNTENTKNIFIYDKALGDKFERASQEQDMRWEGNTGGRYLVPGDEFEVIPLDCLGLNDVDFIKLDVEGYELFALQGAQETIRRCQPVITCEEKQRIMERQGVVQGQIAEFLSTLGYVQVSKQKGDIIYCPKDAHI
jgi:FkbM family methyltransferase